MLRIKLDAALLFSLLILVSVGANAGRLAIVIDDFGYRPHEEQQVLALPTAISIAVLPNAPYAREMATKAHQQGREVYQFLYQFVPVLLCSRLKNWYGLTCFFARLVIIALIHRVDLQQ